MVICRWRALSSGTLFFRLSSFTTSLSKSFSFLMDELSDVDHKERLVIDRHSFMDRTRGPFLFNRFLCLAFALLATLPTNPAYPSEVKGEKYSVRFVVRMTDGQYFSGNSQCSRRYYCDIRFGKSFELSIADYGKSYNLSIMDYDINSLPCCSFPAGKHSIEFSKTENCVSTIFNQSVADDLVYRRATQIGEIFVIISEDK